MFRFIGVILLPLLLSLSCNGLHAAQTTPVFVRTLVEEPFSETIEALGTLRAREAVTLSATVTETITAIHFDDGQRVKQGHVLVEMTSAEEQALLEEARAALAEAERQFKRVQTLEQARLANESLLDQRQQAIESARAHLATIQSRLSDRLILAPFSGLVGLRNISVGSLVKPGDTITTLDDDSIMKLDISIPAVFLKAINVGMKIEARSRELSDAVYTGEVKSLDSRINATTRTITVRAHLQNQTLELKPGMLMTVTLRQPEVQTVFVPEESLIQIGHEKFVYVIRDGDQGLIAKRTQVETGVRRRGEVALKSGLSAGDQVVTHGIIKLKDGAAVKVISRDDGKTSLKDMLNAQAPSGVN